MKLQNSRTCFLSTIALFIFLGPFFVSRVHSSPVKDLNGKSVAAPSLEGETHVMEFVKGEPGKPEPGELVLNYNPTVQLKPRFIVICVGDSVEFKNNWIGQVNAFSYSKAFKFDTGRNFQPGESRAVGPFPDQGLVRVYDEIHSHLKGFILVIDCSSKGREQNLKDGRRKFLEEWVKEGGKVRDITGEKDGERDSSDKQNAPQDSSKTPVHSDFGRGLHTNTFETLYGQLIVNLPDDMRAGDTISGTVITEPKGASKEEQAKNQAELDNLIIALDGIKLPVRQSSFVWHSPAPEASAPARYTLRMFELGGGKELATIDLPPGGKITGGEYIEPPSGKIDRLGVPPFIWSLPTMGQEGRPNSIEGPFGGDFGNTTIKIGGQEVTKLAESPRKCIFESPANIIGPTELTLKERGVEVKGPYRNIAIHLSALQTTLRRGETTTLTVQIEGLQRIKQDVPLELVKLGVVSMEGGDTQIKSISPAEVSPDGSFAITRTITAQQTGAFNVTATVTGNERERVAASGPGFLFKEGPAASGTPLPEATPPGTPAGTKISGGNRPVTAAGLEGQIVHIEGDPRAGVKGLWLIKIKLQSGEKTEIFIQADKKPDLKFCDWIKVGKAHEGVTHPVIDSYEKTEAPKPPTPPVSKTEPPKETPSPSPQVPAINPGPCKDGEERNESEHLIKTFEFMDENSTVTVQFYTDKDGPLDAAKNMAKLFKAPVNVLKALKFLAPSAPGKTPVGLLIEYLNQGGDIIDAIAAGRLATAGVSIVYVQIDMNTVVVTVEKWTVEVCRNGVWVKETRCKETRRRGAYKRGDKIDKNDGTGRWTEISSTAEGFDPQKVDKWVKDFVKLHLEELEANENAYKEFAKDCPK